MSWTTRLSQERKDGSQDDEGGGFFWDPPPSKNRDTKSYNNVRELEERLCQATVRARELEMELEKYRDIVDKKEEITDGHQKAELMRTKQDMVNRIIQIGEKGREAERNMKKLQLDESAFVNDFRAAISKLNSSEQINLVRCALNALELENGACESHDNNEKLDIGRKKNLISQYNHIEESANINGVYDKRETELQNKIQKLEEENKSLSVSIDELDQQHAQSIEKILTLKDELQKKHQCLQVAYETLYVDYNAIQEKIKMLENESTKEKISLEATEQNGTILNLKLATEDKNNQTEQLTMEKKINQIIKNYTDTEVQTEDNNEVDNNVVLNEIAQKVNEIIKNTHIHLEEGETIFEATAKHCIEAEWKIDMLERQLTGLSSELRDTNEIRDSLQMDFDEQQSTIESLEMEIQHMKSNLPSIPEASEERVATLEVETESMAQEIKRLQCEYDTLRNKNSELITSMSNMEGSLRNQENLEAEVRNIKQQLEIAQQQLAGASKNVENNENMMEDLSRRLHSSLDENTELRKKIDNLESRDKQMQEELNVYIEKCKGLDENLELIEELKLDINNVRKELKNSAENTKRLEKELAFADDAKKEIERDILSLSQEKEQLEMEFAMLKKCGSVDEDSEILKDLRSQLESANREKDDLEYDLMNMRKELDLALSESSKRDSLCNELITENERLIKENNIVLEQMGSVTNEWQERLELLQTEMNLLQQEHSILQEEATADKLELAEIRRKTEQLEEKSINIEKNFHASKSECEILKSDCENLRSRANMVTELESELQRMQIIENKLVASASETEELKQKLISLQDESNELTVIREKYLNLKEQLKNTRDLEEKLKNSENRCQQLEDQLAVLISDHQNLLTSKLTDEENQQIRKTLEKKMAELELLIEEKNQLSEKLIACQRDLQSAIDNSKESADMAKETIETLSQIIKQKDQEIESVKSTMASDLEQKMVINESNLTSLNVERDELVKLVQIKHNESLQYHAEIQRMTQLFNDQASALQTAVAERESYENLLKQKEADILWGQNELQVVRQRLKNFEESMNHGETCNIVEHSIQISQVAVLNEKCNAMEAALIKEQSSNRILQSQLTDSQQRESAAAKELERLRSHLVEMEENYTEEALLIEQSKKELETKLLQAEETLKNSSTVYTSANIRANQQVETLQQQMTLIIQQRDEIQNKLSIAEDKVLRHAASLMNLQIVLEQFQRDKESDIQNATSKIREQLKDSHKKQEELNAEIINLKEQLAEAKECLLAASRLSQQLNKKSERIQELNDEVAKLTELVNTAEQRIEEAKQSGEGKVDKSLIKNLLLGFLASSNSDKLSVLRVFATVLDFNEMERDKAGLNHPTAHGGWFSGLLSSGGTPTKDQEASLSAAFVRFLESESKPMPPIPPLPISNTPISRPGHSRQHSSSSTQSGLLLSNMSLPSFPDFIPSRNTGSILKEVLKDS
ncbi:hypothetical protein PV326_011992 [Microctonus aethiopoides]|nr:hypothetical protein PV326_011992 [Microctonus aethiopoides]